MEQAGDRVVLTEAERQAFLHAVREGVFRQLCRDGRLTAVQLEALLERES